jgi:hypothetical protein
MPVWPRGSIGLGQVEAERDMRSSERHPQRVEPGQSALDVGDRGGKFGGRLRAGLAFPFGFARLSIQRSLPPGQPRRGGATESSPAK